jgi:hypothetical protein
MLQKGVFTLHGSRFDLDKDQAPSLVALPIVREAKGQLLVELERIGVDEMTIFPELEHSARHPTAKDQQQVTQESGSKEWQTTFRS